MRLTSGLLIGGFASSAMATSVHYHGFEHFVIFGDSYTDSGMGDYFSLHGGQGPPAGQLPPEKTSGLATGGLVWPQYVREYSKAKMYNYASGGATCSNEIVARYNPFIGINIPSVLENQIPKFEEDARTSLYKGANAANTVYGLWIGTNDLGTSAFLTDSQAPGASLTTYIDCLFSVFDHIYKKGGRRFVLLNNNALELSPAYQDPAKGGLEDNGTWGDKDKYNATEYNQKMMEYTATTNRMMDYGVPFHLLVKNRWRGATFSVFNVHQLAVDIYNNPKEFLEAPYDVQNYYNNGDTTRNINGYLWYDALHPTNKTETYVAKEFIKVAANTSKYGTQYQSK